MWDFDRYDYIPIRISGADEPVGFGFTGFNEADRLKYCPEVLMAEIEQALAKHGVYEHPTKAIRICYTRAL